MNPRFALLPLLLVLSLPLSAETILDDHFTGDALDTDVWQTSEWSTGSISVSDSKLLLGPHVAIDAPDTSGNYISMHLFGVEGTGFGFGLSGALGGWVTLHVDSDHGAMLYLGWAPTPPLYTSEDLRIDLGLTSDGDFQIIWTPTLFQVFNNDNSLYYEDDPQHIPYYGMGPFTLWTDDNDGSLSLDHVVLTIPEPATLSLIAAGLIFQTCCLRKRRA